MDTLTVKGAPGTTIRFGDRGATVPTAAPDVGRFSYSGLGEFLASCKGANVGVKWGGGSDQIQGNVVMVSKA